MDDTNSVELEGALQHRRDVEAALDRIVAGMGITVVAHVNEVLRGDRTGGIPPDAREGIVEILNAKGFVEDADAHIVKLRGYPDAARYHEERRDRYWELREAIREGGGPFRHGSGLLGSSSSQAVSAARSATEVAQDSLRALW